MKFLKKSDVPKRTQIVHTELSTDIKKTDATLITKHKKTAQQIAAMDFAKLKKESKIKNFIGSMTSDYKRLIDKIDQALAGALSIFQSKKDIENAKTTVEDYERKIQEVDDKLALYKGKINEASEKIVSKCNGWLNGKLWVLYGLAGVELVSNYAVYQLLGGSLLAAISISIISAFIVFWWGHVTPKYVVQLGRGNTLRQTLIFSLFATPIFILFYLFSQLRIESLIAENPEMADIFVSSPIIPTLINFFGYLISCYLVYNYRPSKAELDAYKKYKQDTQKIEELNQQREGLIAKKNTEVLQLQQKLTEHYNFLLLAQQLEEDVITCYEGCFQEFRTELYLRTNSKCDPLFSGDIKKDLPPLERKYKTIDKSQFEL
ncbi:hypothetical protein [uncultured Dokdonia sp.]|uniref:hypothetical protein n=1 Tax=uncultured Dokdonia sp. TaxID=575653 RepID=UPI00262566A9|nr:hypothetical protein [uncultured Dokdonia sp.]